LLLLLLLLGRVSNAPHFIVDVVACDFQCRYNFSSHVDQIFDEASLAASIVHSNFWVSTERHPDAIDQMIKTPKKVHQLNLEA
jgi:hypothetical protein